MFIGKDASVYTRIHECSHLVDWVLDLVGVPISVENTEIRAYMMADVCSALDDILEGKNG